MKNNKIKCSNRGFSLIELIVVFAIMGVLVGALIPVLVKYVEKSREAKDLQALSEFHRSVQISLTNEKAHKVLGTGSHMTSSESIYDGTCPADFEELSKEVITIMPTEPKMISKVGKTGDIYVKINNGSVTVYVNLGGSAVTSNMITDRNGNPQKFEVTESW